MVGQLAHIVGWKTAKGSPRSESDLPENERNTVENLLLMCHDQHKVIDTKSLWEVYDEKTLRDFKRSHEDRIRRLTALRDSDASTVLRLVGMSTGIGPTVLA